MLDVIEKLLILQDRDRRISQVKTELAHIEPERHSIQSKLTSAQSSLDAAKLRVKQIETERKKLELEVDARKQQIEKYSLQQFQTKKNEEYRALANEITNCKQQIVALEDQQLELMETAEMAQKEVASASESAGTLRKILENQISDLESKERNLQKQLADYEAGYDELAAVVEEGVLDRYMRIRKQKGGSSVVGVEHSVCGGCHMKLPMQIVVTCQAQQELVCCPNCGRILYYARHMDLAFAD
jgi:uncharacterized protein